MEPATDRASGDIRAAVLPIDVVCRSGDPWSGGRIRIYHPCICTTPLSSAHGSLEKLNAIEQERARIAKDIHDDLGASLTQIHLLSELAHGDLGQPKVAEAHLRKISDTARALTRAMDEIVWAVNPHNDTLDSLMTYMTKYSHEYLGAAHIRCRIDIPTLLPQWPVSSETRHHLFMVLKESLNNIVKHAQPTEVWLRVTLHERAFTLAIEDNGCGMKKATCLPTRWIGSWGNGLGTCINA